MIRYTGYAMLALIPSATQSNTWLLLDHIQERFTMVLVCFVVNVCVFVPNFCEVCQFQLSLSNVWVRSEYQTRTMTF